MSKRSSSSPDNRDLGAHANAVMAAAQNMPPGLERTEAFKKATQLRHATDTYNYLFSEELKPPE
jgi:hypothetical protein